MHKNTEIAAFFKSQAFFDLMLVVPNRIVCYSFCFTDKPTTRPAV